MNLDVFPADISRYGWWVDRLFDIALNLTAVTFIIVVGILLFFLVRYRSRPGHKAHYTHGNSKPAIILTVTLAVLVFFFMKLWVLVPFRVLHQVAEGLSDRSFVFPSWNRQDETGPLMEAFRTAVESIKTDAENKEQSLTDFRIQPLSLPEKVRRRKRSRHRAMHWGLNPGSRFLAF